MSVLNHGYFIDFIRELLSNLLPSGSNFYVNVSPTLRHVPEEIVNKLVETLLSCGNIFQNCRLMYVYVGEEFPRTGRVYSRVEAFLPEATYVIYIYPEEGAILHVSTQVYTPDWYTLYKNLDEPILYPAPTMRGDVLSLMYGVPESLTSEVLRKLPHVRNIVEMINLLRNVHGKVAVKTTPFLNHESLPETLIDVKKVGETYVTVPEPSTRGGYVMHMLFMGEKPRAYEVHIEPDDERYILSITGTALGDLDQVKQLVKDELPEDLEYTNIHCGVTCGAGTRYIRYITESTTRINRGEMKQSTVNKPVVIKEDLDRIIDLAIKNVADLVI